MIQKRQCLRTFQKHEGNLPPPQLNYSSARYSPHSCLFPPTACICIATHAGSCHDDRWHLWRSLAHSSVDQQKFSVIAVWIIPEPREGKQLPEWIKKTLPWVCRKPRTHRWFTSVGICIVFNLIFNQRKQKSHNSIFKHTEEIKHLLKHSSRLISPLPSFSCLFLIIVEVNDRNSRAPTPAQWSHQ